MGNKHLNRRCFVPIAIICVFWNTHTSQVRAAQPVPSGMSIVDFAPTVEILRAGSAVWRPATNNMMLNAGDRVRTRLGSRLTLRLSPDDTVRIHDDSEFLIQPPPPKKKANVS